MTDLLKHRHTLTEPSWPLPLLTHAACVDEQLHIRQADTLKKTAELWGASEQTQ